MSDRLPPLTALRAFEAAARHMSFAKAAEELHVTPAALSFQIKSLETALGQPVFKRLNRAVALTETGEALAPGVTEGFQQLGTAWATARRRAHVTELSITAGPGFTSRWLAPRIFEFASAHPEIELRFAASLKIMDFDRDGVDLAIRFGSTSDDGLYSRILIRDWATPMMSPDRAAEVTIPADLAKMPMFQVSDTAFLDPPLDWPTWFAAAQEPLPPHAGPEFSQHDHALNAAAAGGGAVLGRISLAYDDLITGRLVAPFKLAMRLPGQYRFVCPKGAEKTPAVQAFETWLIGLLQPLEAFDDQMIFAEPSGAAPR